MAVRAALANSRDALAQAQIEEARLVAELLLCHALGVDRAYLLAHPERALTAEERVRWRGLLRRALAHEPLAYVVHRREFYGLDLYVDRRVLIPRPETEVLVEAALAWAREYRRTRGRPPLIADVGTGSGAIALALATHLPEVRVFACDASAGALHVARHNARRHGVAGRVEFRRGNLLEPVPEPVDLVCANLPYVSEAEMAGLPRHIAAFEPRLALAGGVDGLDLYRELLKQTTKVNPGGALLLEIGAAQAESAPALARSLLPGAQVEVLPDLAGLPRLLRVQTPAEPLATTGDEVREQ